MQLTRDPIIRYELQHGGADPQLVRLAEAQHDDNGSVALFQRFEKAGEAGSAFAMCVCHQFSLSGQGTQKSERAAFEWAKRAASLGYPPGLFLLGRCFEVGTGVLGDPERAIELYEGSSAGGFGFASFYLGQCHYSGKLAMNDTARAITYLKLAHEQGEPLAGHCLGEWYEDGDKVPRDEESAVAWYTRASECGNFFSSARLRDAYTSGELGLPSDPELASRYEKIFLAQTAEGSS